MAFRNNKRYLFIGDWVESSFLATMQDQQNEPIPINNEHERLVQQQIEEIEPSDTSENAPVEDLPRISLIRLFFATICYAGLQFGCTL